MEERKQAEHGVSEAEKVQQMGTSSGSQENLSKQSYSMPRLQLLLLGKQGVGKSATGNTILGKVMFKSECSQQMVTKMCQRESGIVRGKETVVVDTPDLFSPIESAEVKQCSIKQCLDLFASPLCVLILVIAIGHYTKEDEETMKGIQEVFGAEAWRRIIIVFTQKDDLGAALLQDYIKNKESLKALVQNVGGRYCVFNNKADEAERASQVSDLFREIKRLVELNPSSGCVDFRVEGSRFQDSMDEATHQEGDELCGSGERQLQTPGPEQVSGIPELRILLVGKRGVGKSTAGNIILQRHAFKTQFSEESVTQTFRSESRVWRGKKVLVIDAPDISSMKDAESELRKHIFPGPHVFLLVIPVGSFNRKDEMVVQSIKINFGDKYIKHMFILLTREEDLESPDQDIATFLRENARLNDLIQKCQERYSTFNNQAKVEEKRIQVDKLLQNVDNMVHQNGNVPCIFREKETISFILVGRSGTGKSATGNTILGKPVFPSQLRARPVTETCQSGRRTLDSQDVVVVDTPSITQISDGEKQSWSEKEVQFCYSLCEEGTKIFVLVVQLGRFTQEDTAAVEHLEAIFGEEVMKYAIVLFTRKEDLRDEKLEDYIKNTDNKDLKKIIKKCGWRVCAFSNRETDQSQETQVKELLQMANNLRNNCSGHGYSCTWEDILHRIKNALEKSNPKNMLRNLKDKLR
ncbi:GTPase IMAP family member 8 isoform X1 [Castor canadensis]|uniref:GTPase IMAP family member 8 isoform X1 n=1 Tax=Castor canadensis TaxID=51338 RepID=UPI003D16EACA